MNLMWKWHNIVCNADGKNMIHNYNGIFTNLFWMCSVLLTDIIRFYLCSITLCTNLEFKLNCIYDEWYINMRLSFKKTLESSEQTSNSEWAVK